jgi:hypothetical protein
MVIILGMTSDVDMLQSRLVKGLGLETTLAQYNVPKDDVPGIVEKALGPVGGHDHPIYGAVVRLLESKY